MKLEASSYVIWDRRSGNYVAKPSGLTPNIMEAKHFATRDEAEKSFTRPDQQVESVVVVKPAWMNR